MCSHSILLHVCLSIGFPELWFYECCHSCYLDNTYEKLTEQEMVERFQHRLQVSTICGSGPLSGLMLDLGLWKIT